MTESGAGPGPSAIGGTGAGKMLRIPMAIRAASGEPEPIVPELVEHARIYMRCRPVSIRSSKVSRNTEVSTLRAGPTELQFLPRTLGRNPHTRHY